MQRKRRGYVTQHTAHTTRRVPGRARRKAGDDPDQQLLEDYFDFENGKIISFKTVRLPVLFQRYKIRYAAAFPGTWLEPRNKNPFAKSLIKIPDLVKMKKTKVCNSCTIQCPEYAGKTIYELDDDDAEPDSKRQKPTIDF